MTEVCTAYTLSEGDCTPPAPLIAESQDASVFAPASQCKHQMSKGNPLASARIPREWMAEIEARAAAIGKTPSEIVRLAIGAYLGMEQAPLLTPLQAIPDLTELVADIDHLKGVIATLQTDIAELRNRPEPIQATRKIEGANKGENTASDTTPPALVQKNAPVAPISDTGRDKPPVKKALVQKPASGALPEGVEIGREYKRSELCAFFGITKNTLSNFPRLARNANMPTHEYLESRLGLSLEEIGKLDNSPVYRVLGVKST